MTATNVMSDTGVLEAVDRILPVLEQYRDEAERERRLPSAVIVAIQKEGLFDCLVPKEYGGMETDFGTYITAVERLARADSAAGWNFAILATGGAQGAFLPEAGAREMYGSAALTAGSIIPRGRAVPVEGGYRVTGRWPLASGAHHARWLGGNCLVFEGDRPRMDAHGAPDFTLMGFPADECTIIDTWYSTGLRGSGSVDIAVEDVFVPERRSFSLFNGQPHVGGALYRMGLDALFLTTLANVGLGIARAAIDAFVELARSKTPTLSQTPLSARPVIHAEVAKAEATLQAARAYMHEVVREMTESVAGGGSVPEATEARRRLANVYAADACETVVDSMYRLGGASAIYSGNPLDRCLRDMHTVNQHLAVSPVWWEKTGQSYFGLGLGMP